jgi:hypothetical protein
MTDLDGLPDLTFVLQFRRTASAVPADHEDAGAGAAATGGEPSPPIDEPPAFASGLTVTTRISNGALSASDTPVPGEVAVMKTTLELDSDGKKFRESGTITFKDDASSQLSFDTIGEGTVVGPVPGGKLTHGVVNWRITGGTGRFKGASGTISSSFLFDPQTDALVDNHLALVWLP